MQIDKIDYYLKRSKASYEFFSEAKALYEECQDLELGDYPKAAYIAYIKTGTVADAADLLNKAGMRLGKRKFISNDISDAIRKQDIDDGRLMRISLELLNKGAHHIDRLFN